MKKLIYERIYQKLSQVIDFESLRKKKYLKYKSSSLMDLHIDFLRVEENDAFVIAMAHNFTKNGDVMAVPDMEIRIFPNTQMAEALTFQFDVFGIFQRVYYDNKINVGLKKDLSSYLVDWLTMIKLNDYQLEKKIMRDNINEINI